MMVAALLFLLAGATPPVKHFDVSAAFVPAKAKGAGAIAVTFVARDPDIRINERPAPRLKVDGAQKVLSQPPAPAEKADLALAGGDPNDVAYLDLLLPVSFPVLVSSGLTGPETVKAELTYFYCSKRDGWCKKGKEELLVDVAPVAGAPRK